MYAEEEVVGQNELLEQMLSVMEPLVAYGFFWDPVEITKTVEILLDVMDSKNDRPFLRKFNPETEFNLFSSLLISRCKE